MTHIGEITGKIETKDFLIQIGEGGWNSKVFINGNECNNVESVNICIKAGRVTTAEIKFYLIKGTKLGDFIEDLRSAISKMYQWIKSK